MSGVIQCIIVDDEVVAREILESHVAKIPSIELVGSSKNAMEAFQLINSKNIDLIFLDINMPEISGLSFARSINKNIKVIFTTAYREYAVEGFDLQAVDYLLKPISFERFEMAVKKCFSTAGSSIEAPMVSAIPEQSDFIFVKSDRKMIKVAFSEIFYIESLGDYIKIFTDSACIVSRETISNMEVKLPVNHFMRIHRSFVIAISRIDSYTHEHITILNKSLPISRSYKKEVIQRLDKY